MSYNGGKIIDCRTGQTLVQHAFPADLIEPVCTFSRYWNVVPLTYDKNGIVTEVPDAPYVLEEARINKIPVRKVENLPAEVTYPINKLLLTGDPADMAARRGADAAGVCGQAVHLPQRTFLY